MAGFCILSTLKTKRMIETNNVKEFQKVLTTNALWHNIYERKTKIFLELFSY